MIYILVTMAYLNYIYEYIRGWEKPYHQDMSIYQPYSNSWDNLYFAQEDYETPPLSSSNGIDLADIRREFKDFRSEAN